MLLPLCLILERWPAYNERLKAEGCRSLRVAVHNQFLVSMGGGERHSCMLAQVLAERGHEVGARLVPAGGRPATGLDVDLRTSRSDCPG